MQNRLFDLLRIFLAKPACDPRSAGEAEVAPFEEQIRREGKWVYDYYEHLRTSSVDPLEYCAAQGARVFSKDGLRALRLFHHAVQRNRNARLLGREINGYRLRYCLGSGGMGAVYSARYRNDPKQPAVALKVVPQESANARRLAEQLERESRALQQISHPNVVKLRDAGYDPQEEVVFIVTEQVPGWSLHDLVVGDDNQPFPAGEAVAVVRAAAEGVKALHAAGVLHRDLKPGNIMLDVRGKVTIIDLGLACLLDPGTAVHATRFCGSPWFASPEQFPDPQKGMFRVVCELDYRCDLYALGKVLYFLVGSGHHWDEKHPPYVLEPEDAALWSGIPEPVKAIILKAVEPEPDDRYQTIDEFIAALDQLGMATPPREVLNRFWAEEGDREAVMNRVGADYATGFIDSASPTNGDLPPAAPVSRRLTRRTALVAAGLALCAAGGGIFLWQRQQGKVPLTGSLDVEIWRRGQEDQPAMALSDPRAVPTEEGDWLRIETHLNRPAYQYLVWFDTTGKVTPFYPWKNGAWMEREVERPLQSLELPSADPEDGKPRRAPIQGGPAGMETILLFVRDEPLPKGINLESWFANVPPQDLVAYQGVVWLENGELIKSETTTRGPISLEQAQPIDGVLAQTRGVLRTQGRELFPLTLAVSFPRVSTAK